jgi:hypothetical protein
MFWLVLTAKFSPTTLLLRFSHRGGSEVYFRTISAQVVTRRES